MTSFTKFVAGARRALGLVGVLALVGCLDDGASHVILRADATDVADATAEAVAADLPEPDAALEVHDGAGDGLDAGDADASTQLALTGVVPHRGLTAGGEPVTLVGSGFVQGLEVFFGEKRAPAAIVQDAATCTAITPPRAPGAVDVRVLRGDGAEAVLTAGFLFHNTVEVLGVEPASGRVEGGEPVTVRGRGLVEGARVYVGGHAALSVAVQDDATLVARTPPGVPGPADVLVVTAGGQALAPAAYAYVEAPRLWALAPASGPLAGGGTTRAHGRGFAADATWRFGDQEAVLLETAGATEALLAVPPGQPGAVDVTVTTAEGADTLPGAYVYDDGAAPGVRLVTVQPDRGPLEGGTEVWLATRGADVALATVRFGALDAEVLHADPATGLLRVRAPAAEAPATVGVTLRTPTGDATLPDSWTWASGPRVTSVEPAWGAAAGGTTVRIAGQGLAGPGLEVLFGAELAADVQPAADGGLAAVTPPGTPGRIDVRVRVGAVEARLAGGFEYRGAFEVVALTPSSGAQAGGTEVRVLGAGFAGADPVGVTIGSRACTHVEVLDDGVIVARTPPNPAA